MCMQKGEWSGWAQAIGVLLTIGAGFVYILVQAKHTARLERERQRLERRRMLHAVFVAVSDSVAVVISLEDELGAKTQEWSTVAEEARRALSTLDAIPLLAVGDIAVVHYLSLAKISLRGVFITCDRARSVVLTDERRANSLRFFKQRHQLLEDLLGRLHELIRKCSTASEIGEDEAMEAVTEQPFEWAAASASDRQG